MKILQSTIYVKILLVFVSELNLCLINFKRNVVKVGVTASLDHQVNAGLRLWN